MPYYEHYHAIVKNRFTNSYRPFWKAHKPGIYVVNSKRGIYVVNSADM